ncbi:MAG: tRNA pseudouridine(55) synthase TruB [Dehalococcoidia bacterium]|nr:tRNA pseudouridine(55) synthase TruB [Dehalococcoidia bacterium]
MARPNIDGVINMDKPTGATSMDMVRMIKRLTGVKRVGHAGTLDPIASGVLPICLGQATRLMEHMVDGRKIYRGELALGVSTDTYDAQGEAVEERPWDAVAREQLEALLPQFTGNVQQRPPMYSALKHQGRRLYDLAREGLEVERPAREVAVFNLALTEWAPPRAVIEAECGRGFYMRTLAHDLGEALGCGAHLSALARLRAGAFRIDDALQSEHLQQAADTGSLDDLILPPDAALVDLEAVAVPPAAERQLRNGQSVPLSEAALTAEHAEQRRAYGEHGRFIGIVRFNRAQSVWQPEKVFNISAPSPLAPEGA